MLTYQQFVSNKGFGVGSVVKITNKSNTYTTYERVFRYFRILEYANYSGRFYTLNYPKDCETKTYIVRGIVIHESFEDYLCCLACVEDRTFCVVGYHGVELNPNKRQPKIVEDYEIRRIEKPKYH